MAGRGRENADSTLIALLAGGATVLAAARETGVSARTIHRRLDDPAFRQQVREAQGNLMEMTSERLSDAAIRAAATMEEILDEVNAPNVQLVAAKAILEYGCRLQEQQDFEARLSALEERLSKQEGTKRSVS